MSCFVLDLHAQTETQHLRETHHSLIFSKLLPSTKKGVMYLLKLVGIIAISAVISAAWGSDLCPSLPAMNCSCPSGWELWEKACYHLTSSKSNWYDANSACQEIGGKMAGPRSNDEMEFMADVARQDDSNYCAWIACNDITVEGSWSCEGQGGEPFLEWGHDQPDNWNMDQNCATIAAMFNDRMDDVSCADPLKAFCVRQAVCTPGQTQPRRYCFFTDARGRILNSTCLLDHVIRELGTDSASACDSACIEEPGCRSFNIKKNRDGKKLCQLNNSTSSEDKDKFQTTSYFCTYSEVCMG
ncbi:uncharacterized protein LOC110988612 [Acanthaster planci]|uniref:Uncharacterized protein LOC110988612 n=1 Tax=Acanthaster planci TaxID=133434 RepID=A0A8B7ZR03_ACAPL|nr:uncharacterized protein LOC110988612 [Acanthaster planci]